MSRAQGILERLEGIVRERARERPTDSYVVRLLDGGHAAIAAKVREEAEELCEAAAGTDAEHTVREAADLLFHTLVLLGSCGIPLGDVYAELERRFGVGGLAERAQRPC